MGAPSRSAIPDKEPPVPSLPRRILLLVALAAPAATPSPAPGAPAQAGPGGADRSRGAALEADPWEFFQLLREATPAGSADVQGFTLRKDAGVFGFSTGILTLVAVEGTTVGAVWQGSGQFTLTPPDPVERWQVERFFESPRVEMPLEGAFLLLGPETLAEVQAALTFGDATPGSDFRKLLEDGAKFLFDERSGTVDEEVVRTFLNGEGEGFLHAHLDPRRGDPHFFRFSSLSAEEVSFGREAGGRGDFYETLTSFHRAEDYPSPDPTEEDRYTTSVMRYEIESWIGNGPSFSARTTAFVTSELDEGAWVAFHLSPDLEVDSLRWDDGSAPDFRRREESGQIWLRLPANPGFRQLTAWYAGKVVEYRDMWYWLDRPTSWYPSTGRTDATFDMTFHTAERYAFLGSGTRTEHAEADGVVTSRWVIENPESQASFNLGDFEEHNVDFPGIPPLRLQVNEDFHRRLLAASLFLQEKNVAEAVAADLSSSLSFFQDVYGPLDVTEFNASEIPYLHGQAFPGLIHLSFSTFLAAEDRAGANEIFRAHEVAHQWWGFSVEPRSYRDRWLSEGLAEFSGLWYMQVARFDPETYFEALQDSRDRIVRRRGRAGPISLGSRVAIGTRDEDYATVVYDKGAWVIHMLRNLLMDLDTMDETAFREFMREVSQRYRNRRLSTPEFQAVLEERLGNVDMQWFFDQWVHGADIPSYRWAWTGEEVAEGYRLTLRVRQSEVPDDFLMVVPVSVDFGAEGSATVRVMVRGPETMLDLPILPRKPDAVRFNDFESVLAQVREEGW